MNDPKLDFEKIKVISETAPQIIGRVPMDLGWSELEWLNCLPKNTYLGIRLSNPSSAPGGYDLPLGADLYVISFHYEPFDAEWVMAQAKRVQAPLVVLNEGSCYDYPLPSNVDFYQFIHWHKTLDNIIRFHPQIQARSKTPRYRVSAICNRATQAKALIFTAIMRHLPANERLVKLSTWVEDKNMHHWQHTGNTVLDDLLDEFRTVWTGHAIDIDGWDDVTHNTEANNTNPWLPQYLDSALHFTNESHHYSLMTDGGHLSIRPGPNLTEKTLKCLVSATPFISVAQFDVYRNLQQLGFQFDYGDVDLSFDQQPGNLDRLQSLVGLIADLARFDTIELSQQCWDSSHHNQDHILSGNLNQICQQINHGTAEAVLAKYG